MLPRLTHAANWRKLSSNTACCFTYGSLMWADIWSVVCGRSHPAVDAELRGYARHPVRGEDYPGLALAAQDARVSGQLYLDVDEASLARLDAFEGEEYERFVVTVQLADGSSRDAFCYRFCGDSAGRLLPSEWDPAAFEREGKARFMAAYPGFAAGKAAS